MRWLKRDEGITIVLVGVSLAVLLALSGMAVDLGVVYAERRELRTGADAAALAIAEDCGMGARPCDQATALATAEEYADANAQDGESAIDTLELTFTSATTGSVRVVTRAWDAATGEPGVRVPLLSLLGFDRVNVGAEATAIFDHPGDGEGLPIIIDTCEFFQADGYGSGNTITLYFHSPSSTDPPPVACPYDPAHKDFPGGFGWLAPNLWGECAAAVAADDWTPGDPGNSIPRACKDAGALHAAIWDKDILIPMFDDLNDQQKEYLVAGLASFHVTAYKLASGSGYTYPSGFRCPLSPSDTCLQGYFVSEAVFEGDPGGEDFGVVLVKLID